MSESIYGYTEIGANYPAYVNYSKTDRGMVLTVRSSGQPTGSEIEFPLVKFWDLVAEVGNWHLPADIEFVPSIFIDEFKSAAEKLQQENAALRAEIEDRKKDIEQSTIECANLKRDEKLCRDAADRLRKELEAVKFDFNLLLSQKELIKEVDQVVNLAREYQKQHEELVSLRAELAIKQGEPAAHTDANGNIWWNIVPVRNAQLYLAAPKEMI